jgi:hypothetical protein
MIQIQRCAQCGDIATDYICDTYVCPKAQCVLEVFVGAAAGVV